MKEAVSSFTKYAAENRGWLICLLCCYGIDRVTTYVCLNNKWFGEANPVALALWSKLGNSGTEIMTILLVALGFFYIGAYGKQYLKDYILPAFCIVYCILMLGNIAAVSLGALGLLKYGRFIDISRIMDYNLFVLIIILGVVAAIFVTRGRALRNREVAMSQSSDSTLSGGSETD